MHFNHNNKILIKVIVRQIGTIYKSNLYIYRVNSTNTQRKYIPLVYTRLTILK